MGNQRQLQNLTRHAQSEAARLAAQRKMYCVWFVAVVVPFAILFCLFPSSNLTSQRTSRLPASAKPKLVSGDDSFRQQVIVDDSMLEQDENVESLTKKLGDRLPDQKPKNKLTAEREPEEGFNSRVGENYRTDTTKSEMHDTAGDGKNKRSNKSVDRKPPATGLERVRVEELDELGSDFGASVNIDRKPNSIGSQKQKGSNVDLLESSDSAQGESDSIGTTSNESPASRGSPKKKRPSEDLLRLSETAGAATKDTLRERSTSTGSQKEKGKSIDSSSRQQKADRNRELILPAVMNKEEGRSSKAKPKPNIPNNLSECDISNGKWILDNSGPRYTNVTCPWIDEESQKCTKSGSLDAQYPQWRWKPDGCVLEQFNAKAFLKRMQRKALAFVGDSLARSQTRSLLCLLSRVESPKSVYVDRENQSASWHFPSSNFTLTTVWSPYLVQETEDWINGVPDGVKKVRLDVVEPRWARLLPRLDAVVLSAGSWFRKPVAYVVKNQLVGCHGCASGAGVKELGMYSAYRAAARSAMIGVTTVAGFTGMTVLQQTIMEDPETFTTSSSSSWRDPERRRRTEKYSNRMNEVQRDEFERAIKRGIPNGSRLELSETTTVTFQHPAFNSTSGNLATPTSSSVNGSISMSSAGHRAPPDFYYIFLHGCLTGPSLTWNQFLLHILRLPPPSMDVAL